MRVGAIVIVLALVVGLTGQISEPTPASADNTATVGWQLFDGDRREADGFGPVGFQFWDPDVDDRVLTWSVTVSSTSDPAGITVTGSRPLVGGSGSFMGQVRPTAGPSSDIEDRIRVAAGDRLTVSYHDARDATGSPRIVRDSIVWRASSRVPDRRELVYASPASTGHVVWGALGTAAPGATVSVHPDSTATTTIASATATSAGRVTIRLPDREVAGSVWLTAKEGGLPRSAAVAVPWSAVVGRVLTPGDLQPVRSAFVDLRAVGGKWSCDGIPNCAGGGPGFTNSDGRWGISPNEVGPGDHEVFATMQEPPLTAEWVGSAYGPSPVRRLTVVDGASTDVGNLLLRAPNVIGRVVDQNGWPVPQAIVEVLDRNGGRLPGGSNSRADGRFGLFLPDGQYRLAIRMYQTCVGGTDRFVDVSVTGGVATPSRFTVSAGSGTSSGDPVEVDLSRALTSLESDIAAPVGEVSIDLDDVEGAGELTTACPDTSLEGKRTTLATPGVELDTGTADFGTADVCVGYSDEQLADSRLKEGELQLLHFKDNGKIANTTTSRDQTANQICGTASSFSPFAVGYKKKATAMTLRRSDGRIQSGEEVRLRGRLVRKSNGAPLAGKRVVLQRKPVGETGWTRVKKAKTNARGRVSFTVSPKRDMVFRLRFKGTIRLKASVDRTRILVR